MAKETATQRKRRLENAKIKRQKKLANEDSDAKHRRLRKRHGRKSVVVMKFVKMTRYKFDNFMPNAVSKN